MGRNKAHFSRELFEFLGDLALNNNREWFKAHKDEYETHVRGPMLTIIERLAVDFPRVAPDLTASPRSLYRVYRDTRFSPDKTPYKTHVAAAFSHQVFPKHESAGLYFHLAADQLWVGGGVYAPQTPQLHRIREHIVANLRSFRSLVESPAFRRIGGVTGTKLQRVPRAFPQNHEAAEYLKLKQYLAGEELDPTLATSPRFYGALLRRFTTLAPFIQFLNTPLLAAARFKL